MYLDACVNDVPDWTKAAASGKEAFGREELGLARLLAC